MLTRNKLLWSNDFRVFCTYFNKTDFQTVWVKAEFRSVGLETLTAVLWKTQMFWNITLCHWQSTSQYFERSQCLYLDSQQPRSLKHSEQWRLHCIPINTHNLSLYNVWQKVKRKFLIFSSHIFPPSRYYNLPRVPMIFCVMQNNHFYDRSVSQNLLLSFWTTTAKKCVLF